MSEQAVITFGERAFESAKVWFRLASVFASVLLPFLRASFCTGGKQRRITDDAVDPSREVTTDNSSVACIKNSELEDPMM
jgi:hypothetical protein